MSVLQLTASPTLAQRRESGEGYRACRAGKPRSDNPHQIGSHAFAAWQVGWDMCSDDNEVQPCGT
jgi:hypothetical protein